MGFRRAALRRLAFEDPQFAGWEVDTRVPSVRDWMQVARLTGQGIDINDPGQADRLDDVLDIICEHLAEWNLEDAAGRPVDVTREAVSPGLDKDAVKALVEAWITALVAVPDPLPRPSTDGSPVDGIPMTPLDQAS